MEQFLRSHMSRFFNFSLLSKISNRIFNNISSISNALEEWGGGKTITIAHPKAHDRFDKCRYASPFSFRCQMPSRPRRLFVQVRQDVFSSISLFVFPCVKMVGLASSYGISSCIRRCTADADGPAT